MATRRRPTHPIPTVTCGHGHHHKNVEDALYCNRDLPITDEQVATLAKTLSPTQGEVLRHLIACDEPMVYFKGGFWTLPSIGRGATPETSWLGEGRWNVGIQTLMALERSGILGRLETGTNYDAAHYPGLRDFVLTERGLLVARHLTGEAP
jgi:hypothetical protein